jgi:hypothetical protein
VKASGLINFDTATEANAKRGTCVLLARGMIVIRDRYLKALRNLIAARFRIAAWK